MGRLQKIRRIELFGGLRTLAEVEAKVAHLRGFVVRLDGLVEGLQPGVAPADRKASTLARGALDQARRTVDERLAGETQHRGLAADAAFRLKARSDAVTRSMAEHA